jgi:KaiC/GvpD/RAD55 family RecA-like ATPase
MPHPNSLSSRDPLERLIPRRVHVLVGGPGTGKTALCLRFVAAGLAAGERAAMIVMSRGSDLKAHAARLGFDLDEALRFGQLILLRYHADFGARLARSASPRCAVDELEQLLTPLQPLRVVIDSFAPFLTDEPGSGQAIAALAAYLERSGATSLLTYPEDVNGGYDRRLEPIMQSAAVILRLERNARHRVDVHALATRTGAGPVAHTDTALPSIVLTS